MNFLTLLSEIEQVDPEVYGRLDSRRRVFKHLSGVGQKLSAAALPLFVGTVFNKAYGQTSAPQAVTDVLNFALKLEYLEMYFYQARTGITGQLSPVNASALATIATDEANHVSFLRGALGSAAIAAPTAATFNFTAKDPVALTNAASYLALAQTFEDLGVRAYKGVAPLSVVMANKTVLTAALSIHGVEARHASHIRSMRRGGNLSTNTTPSQSVPVSPYSGAPKSWISGTDLGGAAASYSAPVYGTGNNTGTAIYGNGSGSGSGPATGVVFPADDNVVQGGVTLSGATLPNTSGFPTAAFSEAFDEGLDLGTVATIARQFIAGNSTFF